MIWEVNAFVEATAISGPEWMYTPPSDSRGVGEAGDGFQQIHAHNPGVVGGAGGHDAHALDVQKIAGGHVQAAEVGRGLVGFDAAAHGPLYRFWLLEDLP